MSNDATFTYQSRPQLDECGLQILSEYATLMSTVERKICAALASGKKSNQLKNPFLRKYEITARQFNSCRVSVEGKIASVKSLQPALIHSLTDRINQLEVKIERYSKRPSRHFVVHQKKRRLIQLKNKLFRMKRDHESGKVKLCFGGKKLFHAQYHLAENGYENHDEWKRNWQSSRNREFFLLGSKDETAGNQSCTATVNTNGTLNLRIRLPYALKDKYGKYFEIRDLSFRYGRDTILSSLADCNERSRLLKAGDESYKNHGQAISYRFRFDEKGLRIFASTSFQPPPVITRKEFGVIGVDINVDHLALVEVDRYGNFLKEQIIPLVTYGKTANQIKAAIGDACAQAVNSAEQAKKPLVVENLDFRKKKSALKESSSPKNSRMLSSFAYNTITTNLKSRALRFGVELRTINPAFTSLIGRIKFAKRYGLSLHHAAALCIARRYQGFSEQPPESLDAIPDGKGGHVACPLPVRNRGEHVWSFWGRLYRKFRAVLAAHFRTRSHRSLDPPSLILVTDESLSKVVGGIPTRESLATLLG
jgi:IS605 OrfB family transposase